MYRLVLGAMLLFAGCGNGNKTADFIFCNDGEPPANPAYGEPAGITKVPEAPPHQEIQYRWRCIEAHVAAEQGHSPAEGVAFLQIEQIWQLMDDGCWTDLGETSRTDEVC